VHLLRQRVLPCDLIDAAERPGPVLGGDAGSMGCVQLVKELSRTDDAERKGWNEFVPSVSRGLRRLDSRLRRLRCGIAWTNDGTSAPRGLLCLGERAAESGSSLMRTVGYSASWNSTRGSRALPVNCVTFDSFRCWATKKFAFALPKKLGSAAIVHQFILAVRPGHWSDVVARYSLQTCRLIQLRMVAHAGRSAELN
jgi:hypothetical protein